MVRVICGESNSGKTTFIKNVYDYLDSLKTKYTCEFKRFVDGSSDDIIAIFEIIDSKKKIALSSGGDSSQIIESNLKKLENELTTDLKNSQDNILWIIACKYGNRTEAAEMRKKKIDEAFGSKHGKIIMIRPPYIYEDKDEQNRIYLGLAEKMILDFEENKND